MIHGRKAIEALRREHGGELPNNFEGYPALYIDKQNNTLCHECANRDIDEGQAVVGGDVFWEGAPTYCDDCGILMESACGDPWGEEE